MSLRAYIDSCVLIAAARGSDGEGVREQAMAVLANPEYDFVSSAFVRLEVLAYRDQRSVAIYDRFFLEVSAWTEITEALVNEAVALRQSLPISPLDSLHAVAARRVSADLFITGENLQKPIHSVPGLRTLCISA